MKFIFMIYFNHFEIPQGKMRIGKFFEKKWKSVKHEIVVIWVYCVTFTLIHLWFIDIKVTDARLLNLVGYS